MAICRLRIAVLKAPFHHPESSAQDLTANLMEVGNVGKPF
jgi:hypothetical protein